MMKKEDLLGLIGLLSIVFLAIVLTSCSQQSNLASTPEELAAMQVEETQVVEKSIICTQEEAKAIVDNLFESYRTDDFELYKEVHGSTCNKFRDLCTNNFEQQVDSFKDAKIEFESITYKEDRDRYVVYYRIETVSGRAKSKYSYPISVKYDKDSGRCHIT